MLSLILEKSRGGDITNENMEIVQMLAGQILDMHELRKKIELQVETQMRAIAPNISAILGTAVGARILARAGSLKRLSSMPASTIQVLGAEKALFRSLKTGARPTKARPVIPARAGTCGTEVAARKDSKDYCRKGGHSIEGRCV